MLVGAGFSPLLPAVNGSHDTMVSSDVKPWLRGRQSVKLQAPTVL